MAMGSNTDGSTLDLTSMLKAWTSFARSASGPAPEAEEEEKGEGEEEEEEEEARVAKRALRKRGESSLCGTEIPVII